MIFVSSARPFTPYPSEYNTNQLAAFKSWEKVADAIVYFNQPQQELQSPKTRFIPAEDFPRILDMAELCANQPGWSCILNADIVITEHFIDVERKLKARKACAASSWRHDFDPKVGLEPRGRTGNGIDFFAATQDFWQKVYHAVPESLRIGVQVWDQWMLAFFAMYAVQGFYDLTPSRCVCHPIHGGRAYGPFGGMVHIHGWPCMSPCAIE